MTQQSVDRLAKMIQSLDRRVTGLSSPQLQFSSVKVEGADGPVSMSIPEVAKETVDIRVEMGELKTSLDELEEALANLNVDLDPAILEALNADIEANRLALEAMETTLSSVPGDIAEAKAAAISAASMTAQEMADLAEAAAIAAAASDASGKADAAQAAAVSAAASDAAAKAAAAQNAAIAAAATTAQSKADAAQAAAVAAAATAAQSKADAAQAAAVAAAATTAQQKADAAQAAAALDAKAKADAAEAAAKAAAATDAQTKATAAQNAAIAAAATDATSKANAAQAAAVSTAATDAKAKADAAQAAAIAAAAVTAQNKADLAEAAAINRAQTYVQSRGSDLVANGTAITKTNANFTNSFDYSNDTPEGASGSFVSKYGQNAYATDELIPFDPKKSYRFSFQLRQTVASVGAGNCAYGYIAPCDVDGNAIDPTSYMYITGTTTTLAQALNPGDTTVKLTSAANWYGSSAKPAGAQSYFRTFLFWDYVDSTGKKWAPGTYSRNRYSGPSWDYAYDDGAVNVSTGVITLRAPYNGPAKPAGTSVSQPSAGGSYIYMPSCVNAQIGTTWTAFAETLVGKIMPTSAQATPSTGGADWGSGLPAATAKIKVGWLLNYAGSSGPGAGKMAVAAVSLSDASAAAYAANNITETQITPDAITAPKIKAGAVIAGKLATDAVLANNIKAGEVVAGKLAVDSVVAANIKAGEVVAGKLAVDAVLAGNIKAGEVTAGKLAVNAVVAGNIAAGQINTNHITANTINGDRITANTIHGDKVTANTLQGNRIVANTVQGDRIVANTLNGDRIIANTITGSHIQGNAIDGKTITGAFIRTAATGPRWELKSSTANTLFAFTNHANETEPAGIAIDTSAGGVRVSSAKISSNPPAVVALSNDTSGFSEVLVAGTGVALQGEKVASLVSQGGPTLSKYVSMSQNPNELEIWGGATGDVKIRAGGAVRMGKDIGTTGGGIWRGFLSDVDKSVMGCTDKHIVVNMSTGTTITGPLTVNGYEIARRGGQGRWSNAAANGGPYKTNLTAVSGTTDASSFTGGNFVTPVAGLWSFAVTWSTQMANGGRAFVDMVIDGAIFRTALPLNEDRCMGSITMPVAAGKTVYCQIYAAGASPHPQTVELHAYRVGP